MTQINQMTREVQGGFFDAEYRLQDISKQGDPLEKLNQHIEWDISISNRREGSTERWASSIRLRDDVQGFDIATSLQCSGRANRVCDKGSIVVHAFFRIDATG